MVAIDGLKIEPPDPALVGAPGQPPEPIARWADIYHPLDERMLEGFGGVSEYGITVRWDKNFLSLIHLTLARRTTLKIYGGVRFGGTLPLDDAWAHGFDHMAIAAGAGRPTIIDIKNNLIRGIRKASDFLMALQLTGAFKDDALANLQVRLPAVVIGGGLTGVDTATELLAYYPLQVEKIARPPRGPGRGRGPGARRRARSTTRSGRSSMSFSPTAGPCAPSGRARRRRARRPTSCRWSAAWGGVTLAYRKRLQDAPAYRLNHEEVEKALEEGIAFAEGMDPVEAVPDAHGHVVAMVFTYAALEASTPGWSCRRGRCSSPPAPPPTSPTRRSTRAASSSTARSSYFKGYRAVRRAPRGLRARTRRQWLLHVVRHATAGSSATTATTTRATPATS